MMSSIARKSEYVTATAAILLGLSVLVGACSSTPQQETTGSIARQPTQVGSAAPLPPVIRAPATRSARQTASYAPRPVAYATPAQVCTCPAPQRYDVTASIPRARPAAPATRQPQKTRFVVHTIAPRETLYSISRKYHTKVSDIATVNRMAANSQLRYGELLVVPTTAR